MRFEKTFDTVETHTSGALCNTILTGIPRLEGHSVAEKMLYFQEHYDWIKTAITCEPRGWDAASAAVMVEPCDPEADVGVFFMMNAGYMPMCGSSTIGFTTAIIETGIIPAVEPYTTVKIETPAGLITAVAEVKDGSVLSVSFENIPCFLYQTRTLDFGEFGPVEVDVAYGGNAFAILPAEPFGLDFSVGSAEKLLAMTELVLKKANAEIGFVHPEKPFINEITQVHWFREPRVHPEARAMTANAALPKNIDRSPCGTGTSARACTEYVKGHLRLGEEFAQESITGGLFTAKVLRPYSVGSYQGGIPSLKGQAFVTAFHKYVLDPTDPLKHGYYFI